jgi:hypothetical protein
VYGDVDTVLAQAHEFDVNNVALGRYMLKNDVRITEFPGKATCGSKAVADVLDGIFIKTSVIAVST